MPSTEKLEKVETLKERIDGSAALLVADYRGLTTADVMELRRSLVQADTRFAVVKNTLMKRAVEESGLSQVSGLLEGPTAVGFVKGDAVAAAKQLVDAARRYPALELKGAWVEGRLLGPEEAQTLATLESREAMLSKIAGVAKAEMSKAAGMFQALQGRFVGLLEAYRDRLPAEGAVGEANAGSAEPATEPVEAQETAPAGEGSADEAPPTQIPASEATDGDAAPETSGEPAATASESEGTTDTGSDSETTTTEQEPAQPEGED